MTARPPEPGTTPSAAARAVAVIGIGVRFPGGVDGLERFWELLANGEDAIGEIPPDRMDTARLYDPEPASPGRIMTRYGGYLTDIDRFDAGFFGISPREAERMDPQQRLVLETAWEALEDAGVDAARLAGRPVGVFVGQWLSDFEARLLAAGERIDFEMTNGSGRYATAGRLSFFLGLEGPSLTLDTACSSALTALHMAVQSLRAGETEMAFAAGVNVILSPHVTIGYSQSRMMAPDGRCKFGDASGDGYVRSEGAGTLLLKPLARALADGDPIHAVIRGSAINNDGASSGLMGRPSRSGQARLIERALHDSGLHGATIGYVEAHGTGTPKGDPVELDAIGQVLATGRESPLPVGSVKTNIGHTEAAAGIAGLVKAILAVKHGKVPPSLHHHTPNPEIDWAGLRLSVPTALAEWPRDRAGAPRRAGVSAFGIAGSNAHVIVEEAPQPPAAPATARPMPARPALLPLSADGAEALGALAGRYAARLESDPRLAAADLAGAVATRRTALRSRAAFVAGDRAALAGALRAYAAGGAASAEGHATLGVGSTRPRIVFVAPGQGGQWVGMARGLVAREPAFRAAIEACEAALSGMVDWSLAAQLAAEPGDGVWRLDRIEVIQPVLASLAIAYAALWRAFGIAPDAVIGHSMGETAAAAIAGALPLEDALRVVVRRSALMARVSGQGGMALVELAPDALAARLAGHEATLSIAAQNGPRSAVIAGETAALDAVLAALEAEGIFCRKVKVDVASHSPQMEPLVAELVGGLGDLRPRPADCPILSTVLGAEIAGEALGAAYWGRNLREPVRFHDAVRAATAEGPALFVELGPHPVLKPALEDMGMVAACCGKRDAEDQEAFLTALGALWAAGLAVDWPRILPVPAGPVALPGYPWQRSRHWSAAAERDAGRGQADGAAAEADEATRTWLHHLAWVDAPCGTPGDAAEGGDWLVLDPDTARGVATAAALRDAGLTARAGTLEDLAGLAAPPRGILARAPEGDDAPFLPVRLLQTCLARGWPALPQLCLATAGAQALEGDPATLVSPAQAGLWGAAGVVGEEYPEVALKLVDLDPAAEPTAEPTAEPANGHAAQAAALAAELLAPDGEARVALRAGRRLAQRFRRGPAPTQRAATRPWRRDAACLVTGGLGGLGLRIARRMAEEGARHLVLLARSPLPPRETWAALDPASADGARVAGIRAIEAAGASVHCISADVAEEAAMRAALAAYEAEARPPVRAVAHAAGRVDSVLAHELTSERFDAVMGPKLAGARVLDRLFPDLDLFVAFSSIATVFRPTGMANYAAANAALEGLVASRLARGQTALAITWGVWPGVGMHRDLGDWGEGDLERRGILPLEPDGAEALFGWLCRQGSSAAVLRIDGDLFAARQRHRTDPLFAEIIAEGAGGASDTAAALANAAGPEERRAILEQAVRASLGAVLKMAPAEVDAEKPLGAMGLNSLMAMELRNRLERALDRPLPATLAWNHPTLRALIAYLDREAAASAEPPATAPQAVPGPAPSASPEAVDPLALDDLLDGLSEQSDADLVAALRAGGGRT